MCEDPNGNILVATGSYLLSYHYNTNQFNIFQVNEGWIPAAKLCTLSDTPFALWALSAKTFPQADLIFDVETDEAGDVYASVSGVGVVKLSGNGELKEVLFPSNGYSTVYRDDQGYIWLGSRYAKLLQYDPRTDNITEHLPEVMARANNNHSLIKGNNGYLYIASLGNGFYEYNPATKEVNNYKNKPSDDRTMGNNWLYDIYQDAEGSVWLSHFISLYGCGLLLPSYKDIHPLQDSRCAEVCSLFHRRRQSREYLGGYRPWTTQDRENNP
jgi:hypothetical protein